MRCPWAACCASREALVCICSFCLLHRPGDVRHLSQLLNSRGCAHAVYLWNIPAHRAAWRSVAAKEGGADQLYHRFCHHLDTDSIYQLNSVLGILPESAYVSPACEFRMSSTCLLLLEIHLED